MHVLLHPVQLRLDVCHELQHHVQVPLFQRAAGQGRGQAQVRRVLVLLFPLSPVGDGGRPDARPHIHPLRTGRTVVHQGKVIRVICVMKIPLVMSCTSTLQRNGGGADRHQAGIRRGILLVHQLLQVTVLPFIRVCDASAVHIHSP